MRRSSEQRASRSTRDRVTQPLRRTGGPVPPGVRQAALFGASCAEPHRGQAEGALRSTGRQTSPEPGRRRSSEHRTPSSTRDRETRALRSTDNPVLSRPGRRRSSEHPTPNLTEARSKALFGAPDTKPHRSRETGPLRRHGAPSSTGARPMALFGAPDAEPHRGQADGALRSTRCRTSPEPGRKRSSEHWTLSSTRDRETHAFRSTDAPVPPPARSHQPLPRAGPQPIHPKSGTRTLWSAGRPAWGPGHAKRHSSERHATRLDGAGKPALFGARAPQLHRSRTNGTLRSAGRPVPPGTGQTALFGAPGGPFHPGQDKRHSSERRAARSTRDREPAALRGQRPPIPPGQGKRHSSERCAPNLTGARQTALFGAPRVEPHPEQGNPRSSEYGQPRSTPGGEPDLLGGPANQPTGFGA
jgi:hypothetical protein